MAQGSSACSMAMAMAVVMVLAMTMAVNASSVHNVGGTYKWNTPSVNNLPTDYLQTWANNQTFVTGDILSMLHLPISLDHQLHRPFPLIFCRWSLLWNKRQQNIRRNRKRRLGSMRGLPFLCHSVRFWCIEISLFSMSMSMSFRFVSSNLIDLSTPDADNLLLFDLRHYVGSRWWCFEPLHAKISGISLESSFDSLGLFSVRSRSAWVLSFPCRPVAAHQILVGVKTNVGRVW